MGVIGRDFDFQGRADSREVAEVQSMAPPPIDRSGLQHTLPGEKPLLDHDLPAITAIGTLARFCARALPVRIADFKATRSAPGA